jgi:hypothetical protein
MITITLWLLVSVGAYNGSTSTPTQVVEKFTSQAECMRLANILAGRQARPAVMCIEATVVKTW